MANLGQEFTQNSQARPPARQRQADAQARQRPFQVGSGLLMVAYPIERLAHLAFQPGPLQWFPRLAPHPGVRFHRLPIVGQRLGVSGHATGLIAGLEQILLGLLPLLGDRVMVGQETVELVKPVGE